jgi:hypothetical protein
MLSSVSPAQVKAWLKKHPRFAYTTCPQLQLAEPD